MHAQIHCAYQSFQDTYFTTSRVGRKLHKIVELGTLAETEDTYDAWSRLFWPSATANLIFLRVSGLTELTGEFRHFYSIMYVMKQFRLALFLLPDIEMLRKSGPLISSINKISTLCEETINLPLTPRVLKGYVVRQLRLLYIPKPLDYVGVSSDGLSGC